MSDLASNTPPGGPQRQDGAGGTKQRGPDSESDSESSAAPTSSSSSGSTIPIEDEQPDPSTDEHHDQQRENAESSLDQPSGQ